MKKVIFAFIASLFIVGSVFAQSHIIQPPMVVPEGFDQPQPRHYPSHYTDTITRVDEQWIKTIGTKTVTIKLSLYPYQKHRNQLDVMVRTPEKITEEGRDKTIIVNYIRSDRDYNVFNLAPTVKEYGPIVSADGKHLSFTYNAGDRKVVIELL